MTHSSHVELALDAWLDDQVGDSSPAYLDEILARTTRTRQRPAWSSLGRWVALPSSPSLVRASRVAWALVVVGLIVAIGAAAVLVGMRRPDALPPPFGPADNGILVYAADDGDLYVVEGPDGTPRPLVTGPEADRFPYFSRDGRSFVFDRQADGSDEIVTMLANADGTDVRPLTDRLSELDWIEWSPDSTRLALVGRIDGERGFWLLDLDGNAELVLAETPGTPFERIDGPTWRPNGHELVFVGRRETPPSSALYLIDLSRDDASPVPVAGASTAQPAQHDLSPDGTKVVYRTWEGDHGELRVVDLVSGDDVVVDFDGTPNDQHPHWSPDGTKLLFEHYSGGFFHLAVGSADGGPITEIGPVRSSFNDEGSDALFSPDGKRVLAFYRNDSTSWILDPAGVVADRQIEETSTPPSWQRVAR